ncbi:MAG: HAMP domain-containing sensor histidine kinase [Clostridiales bacterium]|nr:HAMP domain-containing sensor histidine kinase [Clostridiales bacterium]
MSFRKKIVKVNLKMAVIPLITLLSLLMIVIGGYRHSYHSSTFQGNIFHDEDSFFYAVLGVIVFVVILIVVSCTLYANRMVKQLMVPICELRDGAKRISDGDLTNKIYYSGEDEFAIVCQSFNEMQERLAENIEENIKLQQKKQEMIAGISHDLKSPLTSVKGYARGILEGVADTEEKQQRYLRQIEAKAEEMEHLIDELFLYSKLETNKVSYQFEKCEINQYVEAIQEEYEEAGVQIELGLSATDAYTLIDINHMNRVLRNIINNSIKYNLRSDLRIKLQVIVEEKKIRIEVADNGIGVDEDKLPHIFESFYRADEERRSPEKGSGLGLAIVKNIVEAHHGSVRAKNSGGLVIAIELPRV